MIALLLQVGSASLPAQADAGFLPAALFYAFAALSAGGAIGVVASRSIVRAATFLLAALIGVAGVYFLLDSEFLAAVQLVVYVGGTLILIVFGVMLTSRSPFARFEPSRAEIITASVIAVLLLIALMTSILCMPPSNAEPTTTSGYQMTALGHALLSEYLIPFELASVILLVVMIGAAYLAKGRRSAALPEPQRRSAP